MNPDKIKQALEALKANHDWHKDNDDYDGYFGSALYEINQQTISALLDFTLSAEQQEEADHDEAVRLLGLVFDAWENGVPCHEDGEPDGAYLGMAFRLDDEVFHACCNLLNRLNPPRNAAAQAAQPCRDRLEEAAKIADKFICGVCGLDGKAGNAIHALRTQPAEPKGE